LRKLFRAAASLAAILALSSIAEAQGVPGAASTAPFEIVKSHSDFDLSADGSYTEANEVAYRVLDARGREILQQTTLSYTEDLQSLEVESAYTLKASGEKIDVPEDTIMKGFGATSAPGFQDLRTLTIVFPKLEIGDQAVLVTRFQQKIPLFAGQFATNLAHSRAIKADDTQVTITAPDSGFPLQIDASGLGGGERETFAEKYRWVWSFRNDTPVTFEPDAVTEIDHEPHLIVSSFPGYQAVAAAYAAHFEKKADVTDDLQSLADRLTQGVSDHREQARILYDWVSKNISYVNIVLGAGGFTPHSADQVLATRYGDCKDHVMLLQALLKAKNIETMPALISAGTAFTLSKVASPFYFDHLITYVPEFHLFIDSTARYAPFGVLPLSDADKPVVLVPTGEVSHTPPITADSATSNSTIVSKVASDGTMEGNSQASVTGAFAVTARALMEAIPADREKELLRQLMGAGAEGRLDRHDPTQLTDPYTFDIHYRIPDAVVMPGPGAVPVSSSIKSLESDIAGTLPPSRNSNYLCPSMSRTVSDTVEFPKGTIFISLPKAVDLETEGIHLQTGFTQSGSVVQETAKLRIDHPGTVCTPDYYARVRADMAKMVSSLRAQILYK